MENGPTASTRPRPEKAAMASAICPGTREISASGAFFRSGRHPCWVACGRNNWMSGWSFRIAQFCDLKKSITGQEWRGSKSKWPFSRKAHRCFALVRFASSTKRTSGRSRFACKDATAVPPKVTLPNGFRTCAQEFRPPPPPPPPRRPPAAPPRPPPPPAPPQSPFPSRHQDRRSLAR